MVTFVAIVLLMLIEPMTLIVGVGVGVLMRRRALVEPVALGAAIVLEIILVLALADRGVSPMVLAARGLVMLLWAHVAHIFVHGWSPIEDEDRTALDLRAAAIQDRMLEKVVTFWEDLRNPRPELEPVRIEDVDRVEAMMSKGIDVDSLPDRPFVVQPSGPDAQRTEDGHEGR